MIIVYVPTFTLNYEGLPAVFSKQWLYQRMQRAAEIRLIVYTALNVCTVYACSLITTIIQLTRG